MNRIALKEAYQFYNMIPKSLNKSVISTIKKTEGKTEEQILIEMECPTDSEESIEITMSYDLKL